MTDFLVLPFNELKLSIRNIVLSTCNKVLVQFIRAELATRYHRCSTDAPVGVDRKFRADINSYKLQILNYGQKSKNLRF